MDIFLNFKSKFNENKYHENLDLYTSRMVATHLFLVIACLPIVPYSQYQRYKKNANLGLVIQRTLMICGFYIFFLVFALLLRRYKTRLEPHKKWVRWALDIIYNGASYYFTSLMWQSQKIEDAVLQRYIAGWLHMLIVTALFKIISRWYLKITAYLIPILQIGIGTYEAPVAKNGAPSHNVGVILIAVQFTALLILTVYWGERTERKVFLEKQRLDDETQTFKEILDQSTDGIIIYGIKQNQLQFRNPSIVNFNWWNPNLILKENLQKITITSRKNTSSYLESTTETTIEICSQDEEKNKTASDLLENLIKDYDRVIVQGSDRFDCSRTGTDNIISLTGYAKNNDCDETGCLLNICVLFLTFRGQYSIAFILSDITLVEKLRDNNNYKSRLLASVSHELRTPLNASINFTQMAIENSSVSSEVKEQLLVPSLRSNQLLLHLINDILDFSQMAANKLRLVYENNNMFDTINQCINLIKLQATRKGLDLVTKFENGCSNAIFYTDHNRLKQIILNLLSNAIKFTFEGSITVTVKIAALGLPESLREVPAPSMSGASISSFRKIVEISVEDSGIGISKEGVRKLFKAFEKIELGDRVNINATGVGLGLVISNNLVAMLNNDEQDHQMKVESTPDVGTRFSFQIIEREHQNAFTLVEVLSEADENHNNEMDEIIASKEEHLCSTVNLITRQDSDHKSISPLSFRSWEPTEKANLNPQLCKCPPILVVDDDIFNIVAFEALVKKLDYQCDSAYNGQQALEKVGKRQVQKCGENCIQYKIIFMDCNMPILDGYEATKILNKRMKNKEIPSIPIVACTAFTQESDKQKAFESGMNFHCVKPIKRGDVLDIFGSLSNI